MVESPKAWNPPGAAPEVSGLTMDPAAGGLGDSGALSRALFHFCNEGILLTTPEGGIQAANPEACRILQASEAEICAGGRWAFVDASDPRVPAFLAQRNETGSVRGELAMKRGDGRPFPAEVASAVFLDPLGNRRTITVFRDISDRKGLEEKTAWLAAIVESTDDAVIGKDLDGLITSWNPGATRLYGFAPEEVIGQPISILIPPGREEEWVRIMDAIRRGERIRELDTFRIGKQGLPIPVSVRVSPVFSPNGEVIGASTTARDISERLRIQAEQEALIGDLRKALAEVQTLSGLVPICAHCKKIRDDQGFWTQVEAYIQARSAATFTHGLCPDCARDFFPDFVPPSGKG